MRAPTRIAGAVLIAAMVPAAAGCVSIPSSSGVGEASGVGVTDETAQITNVVRGPTDGASDEEIVLGFFAAMLPYPLNFDVAREYLTPDAAAEWNPEQRVTVYDESPTVHSDGRRATVAVHTSGRLDDRGVWTSATVRSAGETVSLRMAKIDGEWRIAEAPNGTYVNTDYFVRYYQPSSLYFFDPSRTILTPDPVYLAVGDTTATALVQDLLQGPTRDLEDNAVISAVPPDTQLEVSVSVSSSGVAEVPLSANVLTLSSTDRQLLAAQLAWTLRQVEGIDRISISVEGATLPIENAGTVFDADGFAAYDPAGLAGERRLFALSANGLVTISGGVDESLQGSISEVRGGSSAAVQPSGQLAAIVSDDRTSVSVGSIGSSAAENQGVDVWFENGNDLLRPSWDAKQLLWLVDTVPPSDTRRAREAPTGSRIVVITPSRQQYRVHAPWFAEHRVVAFGISRDGVRFAAIVDGPGRSRQLVVSTIARGPAGPTLRQGVSLRPPSPITNTSVRLTRLKDLAWVSPTSLAVLAASGSESLAPYEVRIDGSEIATVIAPTHHPDLVSIAAGPDTDAPIAVAGGGKVYVQAPNLRWRSTKRDDLDLYAPVYPG